MNEIVRNVGRRVKRRAQWLVGQPQLLALLEAQRMEQAQAVANLQAALDALNARMDRDLPAEINRLDGYLAYQSDELRRSIASDGEVARRRITPIGDDLDVLVMGRHFDFVVPTREVGLIAFLTRHGAEAIEPGVRAVIHERLRPGDVVVDAGANIGVHAVEMAAVVGPGGRLVCFEPLPHIADALRRTLLVNGLAGQSEVYSKALSDETGTADLFVASHSPLTSLFPAEDSGSEPPARVELTTLDDAVPSAARVDLVKMDVEGAEPRVWRGMRRVREENHRLAVIVEWSASHFARSGESADDFLSEIVRDGFEVGVIDEDEPGAVVPIDGQDAASLERKNLLLLRGQ
jgi:FkbM family methyltransferase